MGRAARHARHHRRAVPDAHRAGPGLSELPRGTVRSPNIWEHPATYELENRAVDRDGVIEHAITSIADWSSRDVLDLGCGSGFHLPRFAASAAQVYGVEPHPALLRLAERRTWSLANVTLLKGTAQAVPLPDASVDLVHARWAYFFGPGCEPGLREVSRVVRRGGTAFVIDNDATRSTFGRWFRRGYPAIDPVGVERFWARHGWTRVPLDIEWRFDDRADLEVVVRIEFSPEVASAILTEHSGTAVDFAVNLWWRRY
jgi:SAM-dependent methyltransferase